MINYSVIISRNGCNQCNKNHMDPIFPMDILNLAQFDDFNFKIREKFLSENILSSFQNSN